MLLAREEGVDQETENFSFTAGLLHEIGKIVLLLNFPDKFKEFLEVKLRSRGQTNHELEEEVFGFSHSKIGAHLVGLWGLPDPIVEAILFHETPSDCACTDLSPLTFVHVANAFEEKVVRGNNEEMPFKIDQEYLRMAGLYDRIPKWIEQYQGTYGDIDLERL
jgi:HD-like signal output (HDOD) protein